jgi:hypothetical protein
LRSASAIRRYGGIAATIVTAHGRNVASYTIVHLGAFGALITK